MEITIPKRFCGPPTSGNGGYSCGRLAAFVQGPAEITLRAPPPLDTKLSIERHDGVVKLLGMVDTSADANAAAEVARAVEGVKSVDNQLKAAAAAASRFRREG